MSEAVKVNSRRYSSCTTYTADILYGSFGASVGSLVSLLAASRYTSTDSFLHDKHDAALEPFGVTS